jgi:addiction module HigA family antidote
MTQVELAHRINVSYPRINELVKGRRGMTPDTALRLEKLFGMEAQVWLNLQLAYDLYAATHSAASAEIERIQPLQA